MAEFRKRPRNSELLLSDEWREWRLASVDEVKNNIAKIKEMGVLNSSDTARLLDGCVKEKCSCVKQHNISKMEHMILVKTQESRPSDNSFSAQMYSAVTWSSKGGQAAVLLSCEDKITEAICFVLHSIVQKFEEDGKRQEELNKLTKSVEEKFHNGRTILHYAVDQPDNQKYGDYVAKSLKDNFKHGKDLIKFADTDKRTALHFAAIHGNAELCRFLIQDCEMRVDETDKNEENVLHFAVKGEHKALFEYLCKLPEVQSIIGARDTQGKTALHKAAAQGNTEMITTLLSSIRNEDRLVVIRQDDLNGQTALLEAARGGHVEAVELLLKEGADPLCECHYDGRTALHYAVQHSDDKKAKQMAELLLKHCKPEKGKSLLLWASATGTGTAEEYLKTEREKQGGRHRGPGHDTVEEYLKTERENTGQSSEDLLDTAIELGHDKMARELVNRGANTAHLNTRNWTPEEQQRVNNLYNQTRKIEQLRKMGKMPEFGRDQPAMYDSLGRKEFAEGLAALFLNPHVKSPLTVGISGDWGIGKSSLMIQTEIILLKTAAQLAFPNLLETEQFPGCKQIVPSPKGRQIYEKINNAVEDLLRSSTSASEDDPLVQFLDGDYQEKYHEVYKSLALMDRNEMFPRKDDDEAADSSSDQYSLRTVPSILTVRYNAWYYQNELEAWAGLAVEITKAIEESMTRAQRVRCCCRYAWREHGNKIFLEFLLPCLLALFLSVWVAWAVWKLLTRSKHKDLQDLKYGSVPVTVLVVVWTVVRQLMSVLKPISVQIMGYLQLPNHRTNLGYQHQVISDINFLKEEIGEKPCWIWRFIAWLWSLCGLYPDTVKDTSIPRSPPPRKDDIRMIVFVDDLDRCKDKVILQVLSAVNLVLAACNINVVLGMDVKMIGRAMENEFQDYNKKPEELAEKYISKIVQLPLALPDTSEDETKRFLDEQLGPAFQVIRPQDDEPKSPTEQSAGYKQPRADKKKDFVCLDVLQNVTEASQTFLSKPSQIFQQLRRFKICLHGRMPGREKTNGKLRTMSLNIHMIKPNYSNEERTALHYLSNQATGAQRLPREWKRFLTYHRIAWNILSLKKQVKDTPGWQTQLVLWVFCCWQWKHQIDVVIQNWKKWNTVKTGSQREENEDLFKLSKPSLKNIIEHCFNKEEVNKSEEKEEWHSLIDTLSKYDVSMECIQSFQKFRLHCKMGYLSWPNP